ncbi:hypothetical protein GMI69_06585 [Eggerthellaceae bacterium zg-887]|uniref:hypothetical protein n=1 Tax=Xiamenia xianingshaonis TaxID=2682776 RepID=UPI001408E543|nr:hypothetical protein [Xiamenia xianingshaonis]NHM16324.1 hypothetical protein [Xiamenia xianingshaonis]
MARNSEQGQRLVTRRASDRTTWPGAAFVLEALLLLLFVTAALAVLLQLFAWAQLRGNDAAYLTEAVTIATNAAERFAQNPTAVQETSKEGAYDVTYQITPEKNAAGTLYSAHISVARDGGIIYELDTANYVSDKDAKRGYIVTVLPMEGGSFGTLGSNGLEPIDGKAGQRIAPPPAEGEGAEDAGSAEGAKEAPAEEVID